MPGFEQHADQLLKGGWRQGSTFHPTAGIGSELDLPEDAVLLVITQSCSVVGPVLARDPHIELAVATKAGGKFSPRSSEATGRNVRIFCVRLGEGETASAYNVDINRRFNIPREKLLDLSPDGPLCSDTDSLRIANWVARYYNRTALPSLMVTRMSTAKFQAAVSDLLKTDFDGSPLHEGIHSVWGNWAPDDEVGPYEFQLDIVVRDIETQDHLRPLLQQTFGLPDPDPLRIETIEGMAILFEIRVHDQVTLADLDGMKRISEWDLFSGLMEQT